MHATLDQMHIVGHTIKNPLSEWVCANSGCAMPSRGLTSETIIVIFVTVPIHEFDFLVLSAQAVPTPLRLCLGMIMFARADRLYS